MPRLTAIRKQALDGMMKEALFEAAVAALSEHGVDGLTMDRVAAAAGIAKGSLYHYFRSKRELLEFVYAKLIDPIFQHMEQTTANNQPAIEKLSELLHTLLEHIARYAQVHKLLFEDEAAHNLLQSSERRTCDAASRQLAVVFRQGIEEGVFCQGDPLMLANIYLGLCRGILQTHPNLEGREQRESVHGLILGTLLHGIASKKGQVG
jgi:AcrR family transcriptional regulator